MSNFTTVEKVSQTIRSLDSTEWARGQNRVKINNMANCVPSLDSDMAKRIGVKINVNWGEMMVLLAHARRQYMNAFWNQPYFFKVRMPYAPDEYQSEWEAFVTEEINRFMRKSNPYFELHRSRWSAVTAHGLGPQMWFKTDPWLPEFVALADIRIPTDTNLDFKNLDWFNWRKMWTPMELVDEVFPSNKKASNKWDQKAVGLILKNYKQLNVDYPANHYDWMTSPEKLANLMRQDGGYWGSTAVPAIPLNHFYFKDNTEKGNEGWFLRIVPESGAITGGAPAKAATDFLWTSDRPIAKKHQQILHCQFGDLNIDAPFKVQAMRSLGFALMEPCFYQNLTRCRALQHLNDQFNILLRISDPVDKARAAIQEFANMGVIRTGVDIVPQQQRHQVDSELIESTMAQLKQLMNEASSTYTQALDSGTQREQTAYETSVKMQQVNALTAGLLMTAFRYATSEYEEICRRFTLTNSSDEDVQKFQKRCQAMKIPRRWLDVDMWDVEPCSPLGMGNPALAMTEAQQLMQVSGGLDATAQQEVKHEYVLAVTGDPRKAARLVPLNKQRPTSDAARDGQALFGSLMQGVPIPPMQGLNPIDQVEAMMPLFAGKIALIERRNNMATQDEAIGLQNVGQYLSQLIQQLAGDPQQKDRVKQYGDALGKLMNQVKGLAQRGAKAMQQQNGQNGEGAKEAMQLQFKAQESALKFHTKQLTDQQKLKQKDKAFVQEQRRRDAETFAQIQRDKITHGVNELARARQSLKDE